MEGYDTLAMSYLSSPMPANGVQHLDYMTATSGIDFQDQYSNYDTETYMSGDEMNFAQSGGLPHPALKRFSSSFTGAFDEPYVDPTMAHLEHMPPDQSMPESPSIDRDNKLLGFSMPLFNFTLLDFSLRRTSLNMTAQLHGMFFLAESQWPATPDAPPPPPELTCYRRNLFQITGSVTLPKTLRYIMTDQGDRIPILAQELTISATESVEGNPVKIISVPWKTPAGGGPAPAEDKIEKEPTSIPLDATAGQDLDADYTSFPIQWKRLQFRIATANNGRRKELQQHFVIRLKVLATLSTGAKISIAEAQSGAIIVRGRSPRNFQSRKDFPLGTGGGSSRKHMQPSMTRTSTGENSIPQNPLGVKQVKSPPDEVSQMIFHFDNNEMHNTNPEMTEWHQMNSHQPIPEPLPTPTYSTSMIPPLMPQFPGQPSPDLPLTFPNLAAMSTPINLSFSDDEGSPIPRLNKPSSKPPTSHPSPSLVSKPRSATLGTITSPPLSQPSKGRPRFNSQQPSPPISSVSVVAQTPSSAQMPLTTSTNNKMPSQTIPGDEESATGQSYEYEYFPLGLDDWMEPVDAVYRPHVVHHTGPLPQDPKALAARRARSKRYFAEES